MENGFVLIFLLLGESVTCTAVSFSELCNLILFLVPELYQPATYHVSEDGSFEIVDEKTAEKVKSL